MQAAGQISMARNPTPPPTSVQPPRGLEPCPGPLQPTLQTLGHLIDEFRVHADTVVETLIISGGQV